VTSVLLLKVERDDVDWKQVAHVIREGPGGLPGMTRHELADAIEAGRALRMTGEMIDIVRIANLFTQIDELEATVREIALDMLRRVTPKEAGGADPQ
jgi:hypothetical protein